MLHLSIDTLSKGKLRIVSLVPSITELLYSLGLDEEVVGLTKFCVHPSHWHSSKKNIGGTKNLRIEEIIKLQADLIIASKEENLKAEVDIISQDFDVLLTDVISIADGLQLIKDVGKITGKDLSANNLAQDIELAFEVLRQTNLQTQSTANVVYLIWQDPYMTVGGDTFIHNMMSAAGFNNLFENSTRYPAVSLEELDALKPDYIFLSSEPYPFKDMHRAALQKQLPDSTIVLVDGEMFSWYGSRMLAFPKYIKETLVL